MISTIISILLFATLAAARVTVVAALPTLAPLTYPRTVLGKRAVLSAHVQNLATAGPVSYQWEVTKIALGQAEQNPMPLSGENGRTFLIARAACEKHDCQGRNGCVGLLRYSVKVCNRAGCVRSNTVVPNVVAGPADIDLSVFSDEGCNPFKGDVKPLDGFRPARAQLPKLGKLVYPRTVLGEKAVLLTKVLNYGEANPFTVIWEVTKFGFGQAQQEPEVISPASETDTSLTINDAQCEKAKCFGRNGCGGLLRYNAKVCNEVGCVRTNTVSPVVVAGTGAKAEQRFRAAKCNTVGANLEPVGGRRTAPKQLPRLGSLVYPRTVLGEKVELTAPLLNGGRATPVTFQWILATTGFGDVQRPPTDINGANGNTLTISMAQCEKPNCGRHGCTGLRRYAVRVCNEVGCVRSDFAAANVVAGKSEAAHMRFKKAGCDDFLVKNPLRI